MQSAILIALGSNLPFEGMVVPETFDAALNILSRHGVTVAERSPLYASRPVPASNQPDFVNGVASIRTHLSPESLLSLLHDTEERFGRVRYIKNEARTLDLDLIDYQGRISAGGGSAPALPHPRMRDRAFVLLPLRDVMPGWRHPVTGEGVDTLIQALPKPWGLERL